MSEDNGVFEDIAFAITADTGKIGSQTAVLLKSIREYYPNAPVYNFIPESSYPEIEKELQNFFETHSTIITGKIPVPEYPLTALHRAFIKASNSNNKYVAALDSDTILLSKISKPAVEGEPDIYLKPDDIGEQYWGSPRSKDDWLRAYSFFDIHPPKMPSDLYSSVDDSRLFSPYYQGAVVIVSNKEIPSQWLDMTQKSVEENIYNHDEDRMHEQITLSILAQQYKVGLLSEDQNCPLYNKILCPTGTQIVHYFSSDRLYRHKNCSFLNHVSDCAEFDKIIEKPDLSTYYRLFYSNIVSKILPYPYNEKANSPIRWVRTVLRRLS